MKLSRANVQHNLQTVVIGCDYDNPMAVKGVIAVMFQSETYWVLLRVELLLGQIARRHFLQLTPSPPANLRMNMRSARLRFLKFRFWHTRRVPSFPCFRPRDHQRWRTLKTLSQSWSSPPFDFPRLKSKTPPLLPSLFFYLCCFYPAFWPWLRCCLPKASSATPLSLSLYSLPSLCRQTFI